MSLSLPLFGASHPHSEKANISANRLRLSPSGQSLFSTGSATPLEHQEFSSTASLHYLNQPLLVRDQNNNSIYRYLLNHREALHLGAALGIRGNFNIGVTLPIILNQAGRFPGLQTGPVNKKGFGDVTLTLQGGVQDSLTKPFSVGFVLPLTFPTGDESAYMSAGTLVTEPRLVIGAQLADLHFTTAIGYRMVTENTIFDYSETNSVTYRLNAHYSVPHYRWQAELELTGAFNAAAPFKDPSGSPSEFLAGASYPLSEGTSFFLGTGIGLSRGLPNPAFRVVAGITLRNRNNVDQDFDGIPLLHDECPNDPEDFDDFEDDDGCPDFDNDKDRILDPDDSCPTAPEDYDDFEDKDGCPDPDNDQDNILDEDDRCKNDPEDFDGFQDEDGCPEIDNDDDGILDKDDQCPNEPEDQNQIEDEDGCPEFDKDKDGVNDEEDQCPDIPEDRDDFEDEDGCPDESEEEEVVEVTDDEIKVDVDETVFFDSGRAFLKRPGRPVLNQVVALLKNHKRIELLHIIGHTDSVGTKEHNQRLSRLRAIAVRRYFLKRGIEPSRIRIVARGESAPKAPNRTSKGRRQNRRVRFDIIKWTASGSK